MFQRLIGMVAGAWLMLSGLAGPAVAQSSLLFNRPHSGIPSMQGQFPNSIQGGGRAIQQRLPAYSQVRPTVAQMPQQPQTLEPSSLNGQSVELMQYRPRPVMPSRSLSTTGYFVPIPPPQRIQHHDIVTVRVDIVAKMESEGNSQMRRAGNYDLALTDWLIVDWFRWIKPSPQSNGDPRIAGTLNRQNRAEGDIDTSERLQFNIASEVRDIYPNGNLLLGGSNFVRINNEVWKVSLSGICRPQDIGPNNTVLSSNILNLNIKKEEQGQVRDSYRRGWFSRWFERFHPF